LGIGHGARLKLISRFVKWSNSQFVEIGKIGKP
jgi:hypothetical protein